MGRFWAPELTFERSMFARLNARLKPATEAVRLSAASGYALDLKRPPDAVELQIDHNDRLGRSLPNPAEHFWIGPNTRGGDNYIQGGLGPCLTALRGRESRPTTLLATRMIK